ncbi:CtsR family transcriptional regulator [uncultured Fretibacterium sp.]|uniref:CtsR family transcriptional regulator n=1 Tax=uncultured Fretibacterium sp. TaxID=1678694 RepID=UPI0026109433|nr:CtsR family transcriptional regulator [uncultured Fretibacterium sp.]
MPNLTLAIEKYIQELLETETEPSVSLRRKELAEFFGCVPSQINYVLRSRFTPERGFLVESQRGGHGYIRILRISCEEPEERLKHVEDIVGDSISEQDCRRLLQSLQERGLITVRERLLIEVALRHADEMGRSDFDLSQHKRSVIQAEMLKRMLRGLMLA